ncbi:MAG: hypothetical protein WC655_20535 [Candidatus Hydrogenedentales bacterium]|jgi:predicted nucleic acid-binding protein
MRVIVSDSSAPIDLKKGGLLEVFTRLPFDLVVPEDILADELLSFSKAEIGLMRRTMTVAGVEATEMARVLEFQRTRPVLSFHDCTALVIVEREQDSVLLTGDRRLRETAQELEIECHGVLWAVAQIADEKLTSKRALISALEVWQDDILVRLPEAEVAAMIRHLRA